MFEFYIGSHLLMLFLFYYGLFGSFLSAKISYALWLFIPLRFYRLGCYLEQESRLFW